MGSYRAPRSAVILGPAGLGQGQCRAIFAPGAAPAAQRHQSLMLWVSLLPGEARGAACQAGGALLRRHSLWRGRPRLLILGPSSQARGLGKLLVSLRPPPVSEGQADVWPSMVVPGRRLSLCVPTGQGVGHCRTATCCPALQECEPCRGRGGCESGLWGNSDF